MTSYATAEDAIEAIRSGEEDGSVETQEGAPGHVPSRDCPCGPGVILVTTPTGAEIEVYRHRPV